MIGRGSTAYPKKTSRFEDSMPRAMSELPRRPALRVARTAAAVGGSEASGARHRAPGLGVGRPGTSPRSPLHEKKPAGAAGSRVAELEAKLGKAHEQLAEMREQLAAAEKARERFAAKKRDAAADTSAPVEDDEENDVPEEQERQQAEAVATAGVVNGGDEEGRRSVVISMPDMAVADVLEQSVTENEDAQVDQDGGKTTGGDVDGVNNVAVVADDDDGEKGNPEDEQLRSKLVAKDKEVYELRAKLLVKDMEVDDLRAKLAAKDMEVDDLRAKLAAKDMEVDELRVKLVAKDAEVATLRTDNADLMMISEEASDAAKETAAKARGIEHALRESAAREARLAERLRASERAREALEAEERRSRVQSEQWRKAAEEAAAVLGGGADRTDTDDVGVGARRGAEADKNRRHRHSSSGGAGERADRQLGSTDDEAASGRKRKPGATGVAMRVLSDLWKKRGQK